MGETSAATTASIKSKDAWLKTTYWRWHGSDSCIGEGTEIRFSGKYFQNIGVHIGGTYWRKSLFIKSFWGISCQTRSPEPSTRDACTNTVQAAQTHASTQTVESSFSRTLWWKLFLVDRKALLFIFAGPLRKAQKLQRKGLHSKAGNVVANMLLFLWCFGLVRTVKRVADSAQLEAPSKVPRTTWCRMQQVSAIFYFCCCRMGPSGASPKCASRTLLLVIVCLVWEVACMPRTDLGEQSGASSGSGISALGRTAMFLVVLENQVFCQHGSHLVSFAQVLQQCLWAQSCSHTFEEDSG